MTLLPSMTDSNVLFYPQVTSQVLPVKCPTCSNGHDLQFLLWPHSFVLLTSCLISTFMEQPNIFVFCLDGMALVFNNLFFGTTILRPISNSLCPIRGGTSENLMSSRELNMNLCNQFVKTLTSCWLLDSGNCSSKR